MDNFPTVDGLRASEITLENVSVSEDRIIGNIDEISMTPWVLVSIV